MPTPRPSPRIAQPTVIRLACALVALGAAAPALPSRAAESPPPAGDRAELDAKVAAAANGGGREVSIPFADHGGIWNWRAVGRDTLLIEARGGKWYRAKLMSPCFELPFAEAVGFKTNPTGDFDRFSSIVVRGQRCPVISLTETAPPPKPAKRSKAGSPADAGSAPPTPH
jgi:hypothetical protein